MDIEKLNSYGMSMNQVREAVVAENVEIPGGTIEQGKARLLRTLGRVDASEDFNNIVVAPRTKAHCIDDIGHAGGHIRAAHKRTCGSGEARR